MSYEGGGQEREYYSNSDSFHKDYTYDDGEAEPFREANSSKTPSKPKILLMGLKRSGKSSIQKVVFHKMSPNETLFLDSTTKITKEDISNSAFVHFQIWDMPGQIDFLDSNYETEAIFDGCGALIFVIDAQDDYIEAISRLRVTTNRAYKVNPNIKFEIFIHKVDGISDDDKMEKQRDIHSRVAEDIQELTNDVTYSFYLTSIYDHSIFEAFSKVVQKLIPQLPALENLLNILIQNSCIEKAFLFDVNSKIYIATDPYAVDMQSYELCCDMIDLVIDISCIYSNGEDEASSSVIRLTNNTVLYLRQVNRALALVCILREENFEKQGLIDYNFHCFRTGIRQLFHLKEQTDAAEQASLTSAASPQQVNLMANGYSS